MLDFQDAVYGPITYDLVSLLRDAYIQWDEELVLDWVMRYWQRAKRRACRSIRDIDAFYRDFEFMGLQRHLKVLGIFCPPLSPRRQGRLSGRHAAGDGIRAQDRRPLHAS